MYAEDLKVEEIVEAVAQLGTVKQAARQRNMPRQTLDTCTSRLGRRDEVRAVTNKTRKQRATVLGERPRSPTTLPVTHHLLCEHPGHFSFNDSVLYNDGESQTTAQ